MITFSKLLLNFAAEVSQRVQHKIHLQQKKVIHKIKNTKLWKQLNLKMP